MQAWRWYQIPRAGVTGWEPSGFGSGNQNPVFWKSRKHPSPELSLHPWTTFHRGIYLYVISFSFTILQFLCCTKSLTSCFPFFGCHASCCRGVFNECPSSPVYSFTKARCRKWLASELEGLWTTHPSVCCGFPFVSFQMPCNALLLFFFSCWV